MLSDGLRGKTQNMSMSALLLLAMLAANPAVTTAKGHLEAGKLDDVLFALDGQKFEGADVAEASALLVKASAAAVKKKDDVLALQFAQMSLKLTPGIEASLEAATRAAWAGKQFESAEGYADKWLSAAPKSTAAKVVRAQLHAEAGEWKQVLAVLTGVKPAAGDEALVAKLNAQANEALEQKAASQSELRSLELALLKAQEQAAAGTEAPNPVATASSGKVVIYSTAWCGYCKKAKAWLKKKGVDFIERDIEKDEGAAAELAEKATRAGVRPSGVPVIDARGTLILGYDEAAMEKAL